MKKVVISSLAAFLIAVALTYASITFISWEPDPRVWEEETRVFFVFVVMSITGIGVVIMDLE